MNSMRLAFVSCFSIVFALSAVLIPPVAADTTVGGTISVDTTWTLAGSPYIVTSNIYVQGADGEDGITTLTIEPGAVVKFNSGLLMSIGNSSGNQGALIAQGTAAEPIVFTSNQAVPAPGDWRYILFNTTCYGDGTVMEYCVVEYGGSYTGYGALYLNQASPTIRNVTVRSSKFYGAYIYASEPVIENCTFTANQNYDLFYSGTVGGKLSGCTINSGIYYLANTGTVSFSNNTIHYNNDLPIKAYADGVGGISDSSFTNVDTESYIQVQGGIIAKDATWSAAVPYRVTAGMTVMGTDGADGITTLTIEPGATVRFDLHQQLNVGTTVGGPGALKVQGTAGTPVVFTSNQAVPAPGDWSGIRFYDTTDDGSTILDHIVVEYAGYGSKGAVYIEQASPVIGHASIRSCSSYGINLANGQPTIENCLFSFNANYDLYYNGTVGGSVTGSTFNSGILVLGTGLVSFSGNTINYNNSFPVKVYPDQVGALVTGSNFTNVDAASQIEVYNGGYISHDALWTAAVPYLISGGITVLGTDGADVITTLTLAPGARLRFNNGTSLNIGAESGNPGALVALGTEANQILFTSNQTSPAPGNWFGLRFYNTTDDTTSAMAQCVVEYAGYYYGRGIALANAKPSIRNSTIRNNLGDGIYAGGTGSSSAEIQCNTFFGNTNGVNIDGASPLIESNNFIGNSSYGLRNASATTLVAENNWWGDPDGPNTGGDKIYGNVDADPWSASQNRCTGSGENSPPYEPTSPSPADDAVRVSTADGPVLIWSGGDPNPLDSVTYDLFWGTSDSNLQMIAQDIVGSTYQTSGLAQGATYYWRVIAKDSAGLSTPGPVWQFTTDGDQPDLIISALTVTPAGNLQIGSPASLMAEIQNTSAGPVVEAFVVDFKIDGASIGTVQIDPILYGNDSLTVSQNWTYDGGDPTIEIVVDSLSRVTEAIEDNNHYIALLSNVADMTPPSLTFLSPPDGAHLKLINQISLGLNDSQSAVNEAAVITSLAVTDGDGVSISGAKSTSNGLFTFVPDMLPLPDGVYEITLTAVDIYGNAESMSFGFTMDTQPPNKPGITGGVIASGIIQIRPTQNNADQFIVEITGTRDPDTSVWINGEERVIIGYGPWSSQETLLPGENSFEIWLMDRAGNRGESEWIDIAIAAGTGINYEYNASGRMKHAVSN